MVVFVVCGTVKYFLAILVLCIIEIFLDNFWSFLLFIKTFLITKMHMIHVLKGMDNATRHSMAKCVK